MIEENARVVRTDHGYATIESLAESGCSSCSANGACGTAMLAPLFGRRGRQLRAVNSINAKAGDEVIVGLNRTAVVLASLMIYLFPLLMLGIGALLGDAIANAMALEDSEPVAIFTGLGSAGLAFWLVRHLMSIGTFASFFEPVLVSRH